MPMLSRERAEKVLTLGQAGWSVSAIADQLGHSPTTIRAYLSGRTTPGVRAPRPSLLTERLAGYCCQRLAEDPHLRPAILFREVTELGFQGSKATFYRELARRLPLSSGRRQSPPQEDPPQDLPEMSHPSHKPQHAPVLPRPIAPITGEALLSYLTHLAHANYLTLPEVVAVLPSWFSTKINNRDDRAQHLPAHQKICTRHGIWLSDTGEPHLDLAACPEIITAQHRANRLLRRCTPQQLMAAYLTAAKMIPPWPSSPAAIPFHWKHRLLILQTANHRLGTATDHDAYTDAAKYPDAIALAAAILTPTWEGNR